MGKRNPRIMILTASYGDGHLQAARALKQSLLQQGAADVQVIDLMKAAHPLLNTISTSLYIASMQTAQYGADYYGWGYYKTRDTDSNHPWARYLNRLGKKKLSELIRIHRPDAIINAFPYGAASEIGRDWGIPVFTVLTDYALHSRWMHPNTDKYYVAAEELRTELAAKGVPRGRVEVSGIPVRSAFYGAADTNNGFRELLDPSKETVLIAAGAYGVLDQIEEMADSLLKKAACTLAIVCGRNRKLEYKLKEMFAGNPNVRVFGFVDNVHELMALASCIITKAGGLTLSEALTLGLPVFVYKPFDGQEKENALFFMNKGIGQISNSLPELEEQIVRYLSDRSGAAHMRKQMTALRKGRAADTIAGDVFRAIERSAKRPRVPEARRRGFVWPSIDSFKLRWSNFWSMSIKLRQK